MLDSADLAHRFYRREGELLVEFGAHWEVIPARSIPGFFVKREWLNPDALPQVSNCLREVLA